MPNRRMFLFWSGLFVALAVVVPVATTHPRPTPSGASLVDILVDATPLPQYAARGTRYVEAQRGHSYDIRLRNPFPVRVAVALSVDGLNTIDARHTTAAHARKWVLGPYETVTLKGWQVSSTHARRFTFTTEEASFAQQLGRPSDMGVISAVFFRERARAWSLATMEKAEPGSPAPVMPQADAAGPLTGAAKVRSRDAYAATGQGPRTAHAVEQVDIDLETAPALTVDVRYEYHDQLVRLGVLPASGLDDRLDRRERARGFERGYCPEVY